MIHGLDTGFHLAAELAERPDHIATRGTLAKLMVAGDVVAIAPFPSALSRSSCGMSFNGFRLARGRSRCRHAA
jgi:hypothetical protein